MYHVQKIHYFYCFQECRLKSCRCSLSEVNLKQNSFYKHFSENFNSFHDLFDIYFYKLLNYGSSRDSFDIYNGTTHTIGMFRGRLWLQYASRGSYLGNYIKPPHCTYPGCAQCWWSTDYSKVKIRKVAQTNIYFKHDGVTVEFYDNTVG